MPLDLNPPPQYVDVAPDGAGVARGDIAPVDDAFWTDPDGDPLSIRDVWLEKTIDGEGAETLYGFDHVGARPEWVGLNLTRLANGPEGQSRYAVNCRFDSEAVSESIHFVVLGHRVTDGLHDIDAQFWIRTASYQPPPALPASVLAAAGFLFDGSTSPAVLGEYGDLASQNGSTATLDANENDGGAAGVVAAAMNGHKAVQYVGADFSGATISNARPGLSFSIASFEDSYLCICINAYAGNYGGDFQIQQGASGSGFDLLSFPKAAGGVAYRGDTQAVGDVLFALDETHIIEVFNPAGGQMTVTFDGVPVASFAPNTGADNPYQSNVCRLDSRYGSGTRYGFIYARGGAGAIPSDADRTAIRAYVADKFGVPLDA